jgi:uncharacterized protein (DUF3084 family)
MFNNDKKLKLEVIALNSKIEQLKLELKRYEDHSDLNLNRHKHELGVLRSQLEHYEELKKEVLEHRDTKYRIQELNHTLEHTNNSKEKLEAEIVELKEIAKSNAKLKLSYDLIKSENEVLSKVKTNVQPTLDENIMLKCKVESLEKEISIKNELIAEKDRRIDGLEGQTTNLLQAITSFQTKDPVILQPQVIERTILSSKK